MRWVALALCVTLSGCAGVSFQQLDPMLAKKEAPEGAVYYLPKPYLLVAQMPMATAKAPAAPVAAKIGPPPAPAAPAAGGPVVYPATYGPAGGTGGDDGKDDAKDDGATAVAGSSDQSFGGVSQGYMIKLVYLPDMSRPMAFSMQAGVGTASLKPTLQNGWMLTGFDASADAKTSEILTSLASVVTAYKTPGKAAASSDDKSGGGVPGAAGAESDTRPILKPGLYEFRFDVSTGALKGLCPVTYFDGGMTVAPTVRPTNC